ncbi:MAG: sodium:calcium antiporter [Armatimonadetes bacterium]|nr:sodium:calcium antiporter [Armatimonadota bacterium]
MLVAEFFGLLIIITAAAWLLSISAETLAEKYGANFTGSILLAVITTLPEYMFVFWAALKGRYDMAVGSAIGACTLLVTLGYGSVILFSTTRASRKPVQAIILSRHVKIDAMYLLATSLVALVLAWEGDGLDVKDGIILTVVFLFYLVQHYRAAIHHLTTTEHGVTPVKLRKAIMMMIIGGAIIVISAERFVESMVEIAHWLGISPVAVAIVLSPIASELPEKITAYLTVVRNGALAEISVSNFMGSKVNHNSLLLAVLPFVAATAAKKGNVPDIVTVPFVLMTVLTVIASISLARRRLDRWQGWVFLALYLTTIGAAFMVR